MSSVRWRSRHWRSGECGGPPQDGRDRSRERVRERWGDATGVGHEGRVANNNERGGPDHRQPPNSTTANSSSRSELDDGGGEWRRGQPLPSRGGQGDGSRGRSAGREGGRVKQEQTAGRSGSAGKARATFSAAPAQAWGGKPTNAKDNGGPINGKHAAAVKAEPRGWGKPDSNTGSGATQANDWPEPKSSLQKAAGLAAEAPANATGKQAPTGILKREGSDGAKNPNPWAEPTPSESMAMGGDSAFPPPSTEGAERKLSEAPTAAPSSSLPTTSSWGKSQTAVQPSGQAKPASQKAKKKKAEEFPSLSTSLKAPRSQQSTIRKTPQSSAKAVTPAEGKQPGKKAKGPSKKTATPANLASFLSPQLGGDAKGKGAKKQQQPKKAKKVTSKLKPHPGMLAMPKPHPGLANMAGTKRSAPSSSSADRLGMSDFPIDAKGGIVKKGRQRVAPKKKKLSTLKKRVLKERLRVWQEKNGIAADESNDGGSESMDAEQSAKRPRTEGTSRNVEAPPQQEKSTTLLVENYIRTEDDDLADDDEYDEIASNLIGLAGRVGKVLSVFVPRPQSSAPLEANHVGAAFVRFGSGNDVSAARDILDGMVVGGQKIRASVLDSEEVLQFNENGGASVAPSPENDREWRTVVLKVMEERQTSMDESNNAQTDGDIYTSDQGASTSVTTIVFHKILCDDDYEDGEALEESVEDIKGLAQQYGPVISARASTSGDDKGNVCIAYGNRDDAEKALQQLNGIVVGGSKIQVTLDLPPGQRQSTPGEVVLRNVLNDDDFEDEDCLNESLDDIRTMAEKYGSIGTIHAETSGEHKGKVHITYVDGHQVAEQAAQRLNGMVVGGLAISALVGSSAESNSDVPAQEKDQSNEKGKKTEEAPPPMYSGDKIIPERFAACKRVPKIPNPNPGTPRTYASKIPNEQAVPLVIEMLGELMRLQQRAKDDKNARARRRLVMGLREVARGIRARKVKMVVMANNLDQYGAIDAKLQEILDLARAEDLPVVFELNKRKLGKALGKSIKVSVVGIQNADGAHEQFKKLKKMFFE